MGMIRHLKTLCTLSKRRITKQSCAQSVLSQIENLKRDYNPHYKPQVNPRDLHLFFLENGKRHRLVKNENGFSREGKEESIDASEMMDWIEQSQKSFRPMS